MNEAQDPKNEEVEVIPAGKPYKRPDNFTVCGELDPPKVPEVGFVVDPEIKKLVHVLRDKIDDNPYEVPHRWLAFEREYTKAHPYGLKKKSRQEAHFVKEETEEPAETPEGARLKIKGKVAKQIAAAGDNAQKNAVNAAKEGGNIANNAGKIWIDIYRAGQKDERERADAKSRELEALGGLVEKLTAALGAAVSTKQEDTEARLELAGLIKQAQGQIPELPPESKFSAIFGKIIDKAEKILGPILSEKLGLPAAPEAPETKEEK